MNTNPIEFKNYSLNWLIPGIVVWKCPKVLDDLGV